ncbi:hypothetical protein ACIQJT_02415 [Streptomyces sp. NPDC091972]|uniref:hypothetical protein n=1 Tax=Streptomyces sp. NPDC091972 TaxID=3366007 RepID=UPI00380B2233
MSRTDLKSHISVAQSLAPASRTAAANGSGVDLAGFDAATVVLDLGAIGGTTPSFTFEVQESTDNSNFTAVAAADLDSGQPAAVTAGGAVVEIGYRGIKRYLRVAITAASGTTPTLLCSATVVRGKPRKLPA